MTDCFVSDACREFGRDDCVSSCFREAVPGSASSGRRNDVFIFVYVLFVPIESVRLDNPAKFLGAHVCIHVF